jgi:hypothetical protein
MRMNKVKGEGDPKSFFERFHKVGNLRKLCLFCARKPRLHAWALQVQLLTGEYVPILVSLILYINFQAQVQKIAINGATQLVIVGATLGRLLFASRIVVPALGFLGATATYISFAGLLIAAAAYTP